MEENRSEEILQNSGQVEDAGPQEITEYAKQYKTIRCRRCGNEYSALFKECPKCRFSLTRQVLKIVIVLLFVIAMVGSEVFLILRVSKLEEQVNDMNTAISRIENNLEEGESQSVDLANLKYYQEQLLTDASDLSSLEEDRDYLIYASQDGCSACAEANEFIYAFLSNGYPDYIPIYFVTPDSGESLFFDALACENTPTLYRLHGAEILQKAEGVDDVYDMMDQIVTEANESMG